MVLLSEWLQQRRGFETWPVRIAMFCEGNFVEKVIFDAGRVKWPLCTSQNQQIAGMLPAKVAG